jgi:phosphinothricin acetyltransferase
MIAFRHAEEKDLEAIVATYNATVKSRLVTADLDPVTVESRRIWFEQHSPGKRPLWIVMWNNTYAGWVSFSSFYGRPAYDGSVEVSIYINEEFRRKGIGRVCLNKCIKVAPMLNIHTLLGFIFGHNVASLRLFEEGGFQKWAHLPGVANMDGTMRDLIILGKKV